jgi:Domain of unknown function DUF29
MSQSLYDQDFYAWTKEQATAVHNQSWDMVDVEHLGRRSNPWSVSKSMPLKATWPTCWCTC